MKTKYFFANVKKINEVERTIDAVASTADMDRDKDIILPSAFKQSIGAFLSNPVILATHQHRLSTGSSPVIGSAVPESIEITETKVTFTMKFAGTALGEEYWQLYRDRHMRAFSIGFIPIEYEDKKDEKLGWVRTYTKIELLEISAVPVPSNRRALARAKGFFNDEENIKEAIMESVNVIIETKFEEFSVKLDAHLEEIKFLIIADSDSLAKHLLDDVEVPADPASKNNSVEQLFKRMENALKMEVNNVNK